MGKGDPEIIGTRPRVLRDLFDAAGDIGDLTLCADLWMPEEAIAGFTDRIRPHLQAIHQEIEAQTAKFRELIELRREERIDEVVDKSLASLRKRLSGS